MILYLNGAKHILLRMFICIGLMIATPIMAQDSNSIKLSILIAPSEHLKQASLHLEAIKGGTQLTCDQLIQAIHTVDANTNPLYVLAGGAYPEEVLEYRLLRHEALKKRAHWVRQLRTIETQAKFEYSSFLGSLRGGEGIWTIVEISKSELARIGIKPSDFELTIRLVSRRSLGPIILPGLKKVFTRNYLIQNGVAVPRDSNHETDTDTGSEHSPIEIRAVQTF